MTSRAGRRQSKPDQTSSARRRVLAHRQIVEGRARAMRWGAWTTAIFGTLAVLRALPVVLRVAIFRGRHGIGLLIGASLLTPSACTYAPPAAVVHVANHVVRPGTDSIAIAVVASTHRRPTGLAAFPDGGAPRVEREQGIFYLCVPDAVAPAPVLRRIAVVPRPDSLRSGFTAWVSGWEDPEQFVASLRGYTANESRPETHRTAWMIVRLDGTLSPLAEGRAMSGPATSLPRSCEVAAIADGTAWLAQHVAPER